METLELSRSEMSQEDREFYIEWGTSAALSLAIVLLV